MPTKPDEGGVYRILTTAFEARRRFGLGPGLSGVLVTSVDAKSEARDIGIVPGDVFTIIRGAPVATPDDVKKAVRSAHEERLPFIAILVQGKGGPRWVSLSVGRAGL
jgi:serine protease Do